MTSIEVQNFHELVSEFNKTADKYEIAEMIILTPNDQDLGKRIRKYFQEKVKNIENVKKV
jgi:5S rRNA maturation endonuclease (ribonuclease M5)